MNRRDFVKAAAASTLLASCAGRGPLMSKKPKPTMNFLFILTDDLGWRDLGCYGSTFYETPHLDKLAAEGMRFTEAYVASPVCSPTRVSIMTGKHPVRLGTTDWFGAPQPETVHLHPTRHKPLLPAPYVDQMPLSEITLAESLKKAGYTTFFAGKWHLGGNGYYPEDQGFDTNKGGYEKGSPASYFSPYNNPKLPDGPEGEHLPDRLATESIQFLDGQGTKPFFLFLSFYSPHTPLQGRPDLVAKYEAKAAHWPLTGPEFGKEGDHAVRQVQRHAVYAAMVEAMDQAVGKVLRRLEELGLQDTTTVLFTSDNGGLSTAEGAPTSNVPLRAGKGWLYEGGIRVPLIVRSPAVRERGSVCRHPIFSTDYYPTVLSLAGLPAQPAQHCDGVNFAPLLRNECLPDDRPLYWHYPHYGNQGAFPGAAIRLGYYKLIEFFETGKTELYNLKEDLSERYNRADEIPNYNETLLAMLHAWQKEMGARFPTPNPNAGTP